MILSPHYSTCTILYLQIFDDSADMYIAYVHRHSAYVYSCTYVSTHMYCLYTGTFTRMNYNIIHICLLHILYNDYYNIFIILFYAHIIILYIILCTHTCITYIMYACPHVHCRQICTYIHYTHITHTEKKYI